MQILWAGPAILFAAVVIGWAAETAAIFISQGLALALLAWLQTLPEFAVEAVIAWEQEQHLMVANLTGSLRLLVGLGWPLVYFTHAFSARMKKNKTGWPRIQLPPFNGLEVLILLLGTAYMGFVWFKGSLTVGDSFFLIGIYIVYMIKLARGPTNEGEDPEDLPIIGKKIIKLQRFWRNVSVAGLFLVGGILLKVAAHPFLHGLEALALALGVSSFVFIQWMAPFVSEFPEKVTAFQWALKARKVPMALMNMASSNIVQWTVMAGMIPVIFSLSVGHPTPIIFDNIQSQEILLTVVQSLLSVLFLADLEISLFNALGLLLLWAIQFIFPSSRQDILFVYLAWMAAETVILVKNRKLFFAFTEYRRYMKP